MTEHEGKAHHFPFTRHGAHMTEQEIKDEQAKHEQAREAVKHQGTTGDTPPAQTGIPTDFDTDFDVASKIIEKLREGRQEADIPLNDPYRAAVSRHQLAFNSGKYNKPVPMTGANTAAPPKTEQGTPPILKK